MVSWSPEGVWVLLATAGVLLCPTAGRSVNYDSDRLHIDYSEVHVGETVIYTGAVLEYEPYNEWTNGGEAILMENAKIIAEYAASAKAMGTDILVAPEYGLQGLEMHVLIPEDMLSVTQHVPDPKEGVVPCTTSADLGRATALRALSCSALENEMYLVVDLAEVTPCDERDALRACPPSGNTYFNTQVVFDRNGTIIARYRKKNLFLEWQFQPGTESDETALFTTDFGVTFSLQVCFDIAFAHPGLYNVDNNGIKDVAMSTAWVDIMPFLIAPSVQNAWSRGLEVNLLVSGYHRPERSKLGSGIYRGASDLANNYVYDPESGSRLIVSEVESVASVKGTRRPTRRLLRDDSVPPTDDLPRRDHVFVYDDLTNYTQVVLRKGDSDGVQLAEACHDDGLCCTVSYSSVGNLTYSLLAYSGVVIQGYGEYQIYAQICAVVWCHNETVDTCGLMEGEMPPADGFEPFEIHAQFSVDHVYPTVFTRDLVLVDNDSYDYSCDDQRVCQISTGTSVPNLMTAGLYGRWYERDP